MLSLIPASLRQRVLLCLVLATLILQACGANGSDEPEELAFNVDPKLLGATFSDDANVFSVQVPLGWNGVSVHVLQRANRLLAEQNGDKAKPTIVGLFRNEELSAHLTIGHYAVATATERDSVVHGHGDQLRKSVPEGDISQARFLHKGYEIDQFMVTHEQGVVVTLFAFHPERELFQLDYVLPQQSYEKALAALESSIGSISFEH